MIGALNRRQRVLRDLPHVIARKQTKLRASPFDSKVVCHSAFVAGRKCNRRGERGQSSNNLPRHDVERTDGTRNRIDLQRPGRKRRFVVCAVRVRRRIGLSVT